VTPLADHARSTTKVGPGKSASNSKSNALRTKAITVNVYAGLFPKLATYTDSRGWTIDTIAGWNRYVVALPDKGFNALIFFQPEEDSSERAAVSQMPVKEMTAADLMRKVETEIPTQYDMLTVIERKATTHGGLPAEWMVFTGNDVSQPATPTKSMVLAFVKDSRGYVVSARTTSDRFADREKILRCLVRSFSIPDRAARASGVQRPSNAGVGAL
jgi:hypothetical protein